MSAKKITVTVPLQISMQRIAATLCSGLEGGINYWAMIGDYVEPKAIWHGKGDADTFPHIDYPLSKGGSIMVYDRLSEIDPDFDGDDEEDNMPKHCLDLAAIMRGLEVMARVNPYQFSRMLMADGDATTGDVFVQCCIFGEEIYG